MAAEDPRSLIEYPSLFPIKVMGAQHPDFEQAVVDESWRRAKRAQGLRVCAPP